MLQVSAGLTEGIARESNMRVFVKAKGNESYSDQAVVVSAQEDIRRLLQQEAAYRDASPPETADGDALPPEAAASSISSSLSIVGKIVGHGALAIFGHVEGEICASTVVIAEGAQMVGDVVADELTIGGHVKGTIHANRVRLAGTSVVEGDIFHRTLAIVENAQFEGRSRRSANAIDTRSGVHTNRPQSQATPIDGNGNDDETILYLNAVS